jgi:hypothetical protein
MLLERTEVKSNLLDDQQLQAKSVAGGFTANPPKPVSPKL